MALLLAFALAASGSIFGIYKTIFYPDTSGIQNEAQLVTLGEKDVNPAIKFGRVSSGQIKVLAELLLELNDMSTYYAVDLPVKLKTVQSKLRVEMISKDYFHALGVDFELGNSLRNEFNREAAMISSRLWRRVFQGRKDVLGQLITVGKRRFTIVGVVPADFLGLGRKPSDGMLQRTDIWISNSDLRGVTLPRKFDASFSSKMPFMWGLGRLESNVSLAQAQDGVDSAVDKMIAARHLPAGTHLQLVKGIQTAPELRQSVIDTSYYFLFGASILLIFTGFNYANLLSARIPQRCAEIAVRAALGAKRKDLLVQLLLENIPLLFIAIFLGGALYFLLRLFLLNIPPFGDYFSSETLFLDWQTLFFLIGSALLLTLVSSFVPISRLSQGIHAKQASSSITLNSVTTYLRQSVVVQVSISSLVTILGLLYALNFERSSQADWGFDANQLTSINLSMDKGASILDISSIASSGFMLALNKYVNSNRSIKAASVSSTAPTFTGFGEVLLMTPSETPSQNSFDSVAINYVDQSFFTTLGISFDAGHDFNGKDKKMLVVNSAFAKIYFPNQTVVGRYLTFKGGEPARMVIGVVKDVHYQSAGANVKPMIYAPIGILTTPILSFKGSLNYRDLQYDIDRLLKEFDLPLHALDVKSYLDRMQATNKVGLVVLWLISLITFIVLLLTSMSLHSLLKQVVESRKKEFAIHMALGAKRRNILHLLYKNSYRLIVFGLLITVPVFMLVFSLLNKYFVEISVVDVFFVVQIVWLIMAANFLFLITITRHLFLRSPAVLFRAN